MVAFFPRSGRPEGALYCIAEECPFGGDRYAVMQTALKPAAVIRQDRSSPRPAVIYSFPISSRITTIISTAPNPPAG